MSIDSAVDVASRPSRSGVRADLIAAAAALLLVAAANLVITVGHWYPLGKIFVWAPPLFGEWHPHVGPGLPLAIAVAGLVIWRGPAVAARMSWPALRVWAYLGCVAWSLSVALIDGWQRGVPDRISTPDQYLVDVPGITDVSRFLHTFTSRVLSGQHNSWITEVAGHPPGATLVFVWLDRLGLGGGVAAGLACVLVGSVTAVAVPATIRALGNESVARAAVPFAVLIPGAGIAGVSADWLFAGVSATGIALLAIGATGLRAAPGHWPARGVVSCAGAGLVFGFCLFLSYGLTLLVFLALGVCLVARCWRAVPIAVVGALVVVGVFAAAGFWWLDGYELVIRRYYQDVGLTRPYNYWVWADLACLTLSAGPAFAAGLRRAGVTVWSEFRVRATSAGFAVAALAVAAAVSIAVADESGLSKAETERIWLPFAVWLTASAALIPARCRRWWLAAQVCTAIAVKVMVWTQW